MGWGPIRATGSACAPSPATATATATAEVRQASRHSQAILNQLALQHQLNPLTLRMSELVDPERAAKAARAKEKVS